LLKRGIDDKVVRAVYSQSDLPVDYKGWKKQVIKHDGLNQAFWVMEGSLRDRGEHGFHPKDALLLLPFEQHRERAQDRVERSGE
jgi:hypothetical protein